jgi:hypothetical protein
MEVAWIFGTPIPVYETHVVTIHKQNIQRRFTDITSEMIHIVTCMGDYRWGFGLDIGLIDHLYIHDS